MAVIYIMNCVLCQVLIIQTTVWAHLQERPNSIPATSWWGCLRTHFKHSGTGNIIIYIIYYTVYIK